MKDSTFFGKILTIETESIFDSRN